MKVKLVRRWGRHLAGRAVEVSDSQGEWLIQHNYAESAGDVHAPVQQAAAEGAHGADPLAGGDATRLRPRVGRPARDERLNYASPASGSSPAYRPGFDAEASRRQGAAGRDQAADGDADVKKPRRSRSKSES